MEQMEMIQVLITDDNPVIRRGLKSLLEEEPDMAVVGEASTGSEAIDLAARTAPDVVLMDIRMPKMNGIEATGKIIKSNPQANILIMTGLDDPTTLAQALMAGAKGCLIYSRFAPEEVAKAIREVASGKTMMVTSSVALAMLELTGNTPSERPHPAQGSAYLLITPKEESIINLIAEGKSNAEIAELLEIKEKTVKNHINHIYCKLSIKSRYEVISFKLRPKS